jgi:transcription elongation factor GreA-like protein
VKYATFSQDLKSLIVEIEKRTKKAEYKLLIKDCYNLYCEERSKLLHSTVRLKMHEIVMKAAQDVQSLTRTGIAYLIELAIAEIGL